MDPMGLNSSNLYREKKTPRKGGEKGGARKGQLAGRIFDEKHLTSFANGADQRLTGPNGFGDLINRNIGKNEGP